MLLAWNTLTESVNYLSSNTGRKWNEREVIQASLDFGIFLHAQINTDRDDVPKWMKENEIVELPFNIDLLRFLGGEGLIQIVRYKDNLYKFEPGIKAELENLRMSKNALCELLERFEAKNKEHNSLKLEELVVANINTRESKQLEPEIHTLFDPMHKKAITLLFDRVTELRWKEFFNRAKRNGLKDIRETNGKYNPAKIAEWLVNKGAYTKEQVDRKLANNLPERSKDKKYLITGDFD